MALEPLRTDRSRLHLQETFFVLSVWVLWLCFMSVLRFPLKLSFPGTAFVLFFGAVWWEFFEGLAMLLLMSFIYRGVSITPSGYYFVCLLIAFMVLRVVIQNFSVRSKFQFAFAIFLTVLGLDFLQIILLGRTTPIRVFHWSLVFFDFVSAFVQAALAFFAAKPMIALLGRR